MNVGKICCLIFVWELFKLMLLVLLVMPLLFHPIAYFLSFIPEKFLLQTNALKSNNLVNGGKNMKTSEIKKRI